MCRERWCFLVIWFVVLAISIGFDGKLAEFARRLVFIICVVRFVQVLLYLEDCKQDSESTVVNLLQIFIFGVCHRNTIVYRQKTERHKHLS